MSTFSQNVFRLLRGSLLAQTISFAALPLLARLYTPDDFGLTQATLSLLTILLIVSSLRLEVALMTEDESKLELLLRVAAWLSVATALCVMVIAIAWALNTDATHVQRVLVLLLPAIAVIAGWYQLLNYVSLRRHAFRETSNSKVVQAGCHTGSASLLGTMHASAPGLLVADLLGRAGALMFLANRMALQWARLLRPPTWQEVSSCLVRHQALVTIGLGSALINAAGSAFTTLMLMWLFGAAEAGQYAMVERFIGMPVGLLAGAASQVFMAHLSRLLGDGNIDQAVALHRRIVRQHLLLAVPLSLAIFALAPTVLSFLLGAEWSAAGTFAQAMLPVYLMSLVTGPVNMTLTLLRRQHLQMMWDVARLFVTGSVWLFIWFCNLNPANALLVHSTAAAAFYVWLLWLNDAALRGYRRSAITKDL
jgi:O-antigen/teichoic acid export membrane protein